MLIGIDASPLARERRTGTERYTLEIVRHMLALPQACEHTWRLYVASPLEIDPMLGPALAYTRSRVHVRVLPESRMWTHRRLGHEVFAHPPDVLFVPGHVLPMALWPRRLPPSVVTLHDVAFRRYPETYSLQSRAYLDLSYRYAVQQASRLIAVSHATADDLALHYEPEPDQVRVVHEAATPLRAPSSTMTATVHAKFGLSRPYALFVGTVQPRKNLVRLIQAHARLLAAGVYDVDLVIAGAAGARSAETIGEAARLGIADRVLFTGYLGEDERAALLGGARFFCYPSLFEGFGLPVLEAQSAGLPVVTANNSSLPEIAGDAALLVDPLDVDALADAMLRLSSDESLRQHLIDAGYENAKRFSWEKAARETLAVLEEAATTARQPQKK